MRRVDYEWVVEEMDGDEIVDTSGFDTLEAAKAYAGANCVICLRRDVGTGPDKDHLDLADRQYAYPGDTEFEAGAAIPKALYAQFLTLETSHAEG